MKKLLLFTISAALGFTSYGQFFQGFENWTTTSVPNLDDHETMVNERWVEGGMAIFPSTDAHSGTYSVRLETVISPTFGDTIFGYFTSGDPDNLTPGQAISLNGVDSIIGYYKYDIKAGDSCSMIVGTSFMSNPTGGGIFYIPAGVQTTWKRFAYSINAPFSDSLLLAAASGDPLSGWYGKPGTWIQFDDIQLKKGTQTISVLNGGFENWTNISADDPTGWKTSNLVAIGEPVLPVIKSTDKYSGNFAMELTTITNGNNDTIAGIATNGDFDENGLFGGEPYTSNPVAVEFYYKNTVSGTDTSWVSLEFKNNGSSVGNYGAQITPASSYTLFNQPISLSMAPDTVLVGAFSGENPGSKLFIDQISFVFPVGVSENLVVNKLVSYPNPATDEIKIKFDIKNNSNVSIRLIDITGKELTNHSLGQLSSGTYRESFNTSSFASGVYFIEFSLDGEKIIERFMIK